MIFDKIKFLCKQKGVTISELEKLLGFGNGSIHKWKKANPNINSLMKVAEHFGISIQYFVDSGIKMLSTEALNFAIEYENLSDKQKAAIKCYLSII